jgi:hypothetical protein
MFYSLYVDSRTKRVDMMKIARPDIAPQNFNPWSLTFDHVLFDVLHVAITVLLIMTVE